MIEITILTRHYGDFDTVAYACFAYALLLALIND